MPQKGKATKGNYLRGLCVFVLDENLPPGLAAFAYWKSKSDCVLIIVT